jgi:hypothetical protein
MVALTYQQRVALQWLVVATASLLAVASFLAAIYHRMSSDIIQDIAEGRRQLRADYVWFGESKNRRLFHGRNVNGELLCNGLSNLCDLPANEIVYATLHNAGSTVESGSLIFKNHILDLGRALTAGYRGINLDIGKCFGQVKLVHGPCLTSSRNLSTVLTHIATFLEENPNEVLILPTQLATPLSGGDSVTLRAIEQGFKAVPEFYNQLYNHPGVGQAWPTLRELIAANTRILFFHYNGESCTKVTLPSNETDACPFGFHPWFLYAAETKFSFSTLKQLQNTSNSCMVTRGGSSVKDFFGVNVFLTPPQITPTLKSINKYDFLKPHVQACTDLNGGLQVNLILINYWGIGDLLKVVFDLNSAL